MRGLGVRAPRKHGPGSEKNRSRAPRGAPLRSQGEAGARRSAPGGFAGRPGASQAPAFLGAPLPFSWERTDAQTPGALAPRHQSGTPK